MYIYERLALLANFKMFNFGLLIVFSIGFSYSFFV